MGEAAVRDATSRGRPADPELQGRFIQAALDLLADRGYRAVTTAAIAKRAGASTASLYRRWPTKQALVTDIARTLTLDALGGIDTGSLAGDVYEFISRKRRLIHHVGTALLALLSEASHDDELRDILRHEVMDTTSQHAANLLERAAARGEIPTPDPWTVRTLSAVVIGSELVLHALPSTSSEGPDDLAIDAEVDMIVRAFSTPPVRPYLATDS